MKWRQIGALSAAIALTAATAAGGTLMAEGDFSAIGSSLDWEPDCSEPSKPWSRDADDVQRYLRDAKEYVSCVNDQASEDAEFAVTRVREGRDDAIEEMISEVRSLN